MRNETEVPLKIMSVLHCSIFAHNYAINIFWCKVLMYGKKWK